MRRGQRLRPIAYRRRSISHTITKRPCRPVVGRFRDTLDKNENSVSIVQHSRMRLKADWSCVRVRNSDMLSLTSYPVHPSPSRGWWALAEEVH